MRVQEIFECLACGGDELEEVLHGVVIATPVVELYSSRPGDAEYARQHPNVEDWLEDSRRFYRCKSCGLDLPPWVNDTGNLWLYLKRPSCRVRPRGAAEDAVYEFDRYAVCVSGVDRVRAVMRQLVADSYVEVLPLPDDMYEISVRLDRKEKLRAEVRGVMT